MIKRIPHLLLLLTLLVGTASAQLVTYESVRPLAYDLRTMDIVWPSETVAFAVGQRNSPQDAIRGAVLRTDDGGDNWTLINRESVNLNDIDAVSETTVMTVGQSTMCGCAVIQRSTDAGATWNETTFSNISELRAIDFTSATTGYAVGSSGAVMKTTNAGVDWTNVGPGPSESVTFWAVHFGTADTGWAVAQYTAHVEPNRVYKTTDAGATWTKIMDQGDAGANKPVFFDVWATNGRNVHLAGREGIRRIYRSTDGGATWRATYNGLPTPTPFSMNAIEFVNDTLGFAAGDFGTMLRSTNSGINWQKEDPGTETALTALGFHSQYLGIVGGLVGEFLKRSISEQPTISVSESTLDFGTMSEGSKDLTVIISPANGAGLTITDIDVNDFDGAGFELISPTQFPIELEADDEEVVTVRFTPESGLNKRVFGSLAISTNDARTPVKTVTLIADATTVTAKPQIQVSASNLTFGTLIERNSKDLSLTISAGTEAVLSLDSLWIVRQSPGADAFSIVTPASGYPIEIPEGQPLTVTVRYAPARPTEFPAQAELVILSNDPDNTELRVSLSGSAQVDPASIEDEALRAALAIAVTPSPVTGSTRVSMTLPRAGHLSARLFDARGTEVATLVDEPSDAGLRTFGLDAAGLASGAYTLVVTIDGRTVSERISVVR